MSHEFAKNMENLCFLEANTTGSPNSVGVRCSFFVEKIEFRTYFVYFYTFSYKFKVQRTHTELGLPVLTHAPTGALFSPRAKRPRIVIYSHQGYHKQSLKDVIRYGKGQPEAEVSR